MREKWKRVVVVIMRESTFETGIFPSHNTLRVGARSRTRYTLNRQVAPSVWRGSASVTTVLIPIGNFKQLDPDDCWVWRRDLTSLV